MVWLFAVLLGIGGVSSAWAGDCASPATGPAAIIHLYGADAETSLEIHAQLAESGHFPSYYGHNLDALYDVLVNFEQDLTVHWENSETSIEHLGHERFTQFVDVFRQAGMDNKNYRICLELR